MLTSKTIPRAIIVVVLICLAINLGIAALIVVDRPEYLADYRLSNNPDCLDYVLLGENLLLHGQFSRSTQPPYLPDMVRTPIYPVFAGALELAGRAGAIYCAQIVLQAASCVLLFLLVKSFFGPRPAFWAAALFATDLVLAVNNFWPMSESLFLFLVLASAAVALPVLLSPGDEDDSDCRGWRCRGWRIVGGGLLLGAAILTRPAGLYLPLVYSVGCLGIGLYQKRLGTAVRMAAVLLLISLIPPALWIARNTVTFSVSKLTAVETNNMLYFVGAGAYQVRHGVGLEEAQAMIAEEFDVAPYSEVQNAHASDRSVAELNAELRAVQWDVLGKYPAQLALSSVMALAKASFSHATGQLAEMLGRQWVAPGTRSLVLHPMAAAKRLWQNGPVLAAAFIWQLAHVIVALGTALFGLTCVMRDRQTRMVGLVLLAVLGYFYLIVAMFGFEAYWRCRVPVLPFLYVFSGYGISRMFPRAESRARP